MDDGEPMAEESAPQEEVSEDSAKTALVDSSLCPGMKPGDEFTVRVEKVLDSGEYQISYPGGESKEEEPMMEESMSPEGSEVDAYMT